MMPIAATENLVGKVKEVEEKTVSAFESGGQINEHLESESRCRFDEFNNLVEVTYVIPEKHHQKTFNKFDSQNRLIETICHFENSRNYRREFFYNSENLIEEIKYYDEKDFLTETLRSIYTKDNLRIEESIHEQTIDGKFVNKFINYKIAPEVEIGFSGENVYKSKSIYDLSNKLREVSFYSENDKLTGKIFVIHDNENKPVEITIFGNGSSFIPTNSAKWQDFLSRKLENSMMNLEAVYKLSVRGDFKKAKNCFAYGSPFEQMFLEYDENKKVCSVKKFSTCNPSSKKIFKYDENGNKTEEILYSENSISAHQKWEYAYDSQNNWIKRETLYKLPVAGKGFIERMVINYRKIKYY